MIKLTSNLVTVGVLLDEIPSMSLNATLTFLTKKPDSWWIKRINKQVFLSQFRMVFRNYYYTDLVVNQIIVPNITQWTITMKPPTTRVIDGHNLLVRDYSFTTYILGPFGNAIVSDPRLYKIGNSVSEIFNLPVDPQMLLQRSGFAWFVVAITILFVLCF